MTFVGLIAINFVVSLLVSWMLQFATKAFNLGVGQQTVQLLSYIPLGYFCCRKFRYADSKHLRPMECGEN